MQSKTLLRTRALFLAMNPSVFWKIYKLRKVQKRLVIVIVYDNSFQIPTRSGLAQRNLAQLFEFFESNQVNFVLIRPLFGVRQFSRKSHKLLSIEGLAIWEIFEGLRFQITRYKTVYSELGKLQQRIWERCFTLLNPIFVLGQSVPEPVFQACRTLGIKSAEIQHGIWFEGEKPILSFDYGDESKSPNYVLTWHEHYSNLIGNSAPICKKIGYPSTFDNSEFRKTKSEELRSVLVCLTTGLSSSLDPFGMIHLEVDQIIKSCLRRGIRVYLRPHPLSDQRTLKRNKAYRWLKKNYKSCFVQSPFENSFNDQARELDAISSFDGSTLIDGFMRGIPTFYLSRHLNVGIPPDILKSKIIFKVNSIEEILLMYESITISNFEIGNILQDWSFNPNMLIEFFNNAEK